MAERCYLAIDLGAESGRVIAGLLDGRRIRLDELHRFANGPVHLGDTMRWDVVRLWSEIQTGLAKAAQKYGDSIVSVGVDTWGVDYVLLSKKDEILGQPYHYRDPRTRGLMDAAISQLSRKEIFENTGLQFMEINSLYQLLASRRSSPELFDVADRFLMMPDFFHWLLCGSRVVEFTNATTSQCFHPTQKTWAFDMLRKLDIPTHIFPEVVAPGTSLGQLRESVARRSGLPRLNVVAPATHDTGAAIAAVPAALTGSTKWAYISSGTWSLMGIESAHAILTPKALELNITNEGGIDNTYRVLKNIMGMWLVQQCRKSFERHGASYDYGLLTQIARDAKSFRAFINPDSPLFVAPEDMPAAIRTYCQKTNQEVPDDEGAVIRCALESLALKYRQVLERLEGLSGEKTEVIHIVGGGSQNELLNQFAADACHRPVIAGPIEATALGNVLVQARTSGELSNLADLRAVVRESASVRHYEPQNSAAWDDAYARFINLPALPA